MKRLLCTSIILVTLLTACSAPVQQLPPSTEPSGNYTYGIYELNFDIEHLSGWPFEGWDFVYTYNGEKIQNGHSCRQVWWLVGCIIWIVEVVVSGVFWTLMPSLYRSHSSSRQSIIFRLCYRIEVLLNWHKCQLTCRKLNPNLRKLNWEGRKLNPDPRKLNPSLGTVFQIKIGNWFISGMYSWRNMVITPLYLVTDHAGFYERYGWEFLCMV